MKEVISLESEMNFDYDKAVQIKEEKEGHGKCHDCIWFEVPQGCNVERDSPACLLNYKEKDF